MRCRQSGSRIDLVVKVVGSKWIQNAHLEGENVRVSSRTDLVVKVGEDEGDRGPKVTGLDDLEGRRTESWSEQER